MTLRVQRLIALAFAGWMLFDFPLLALWSSNAPLVFAWWALLIVLLAVVVERRGGSHDDDDVDVDASRADAAPQDKAST